MKIILTDTNERLIKKVKVAIKHLPFKDNVFVGSLDIRNYLGDKSVVVCSASNPDFTFCGGVDAVIAPFFTGEIKELKKNKNQRVGNLVALVTVDNDLKSSRALVDEALAFAFEKTKERETLVLTGLGTGIGGLDEDEFVWLFVSNLCTAFGYGWGVKYVKKNGYDFYTGKVLYKAGSWVEQLDAIKSSDDCGVGLHLGKNFAGAGNYNIPEKIFICLYKDKDICNVSEDKVRLRRLLVLYQCPLWLGYGLNGKKILRKAGKPFDSEKYNPYQATKLPGRELLTHAWYQVWDQVKGQVWVAFYWSVNKHFSLGINHPYFDFLKLGVIVVFVNGKVKVFGKKGVYLGEYDEEDLK